MKQLILSFWVVLFGFISNGVAQTISQEILLRPGWNSVYLNVQPEPQDVETVLQGLDIISIWTWNENYSSVQFIQNPDELRPDSPGWLNYFAPGIYDPQLNNLHVIKGGRAYLIEYGGTTDFTWEIEGTPLPSQTDWRTDSFNLVGFSVDDTLPPSFEDFLAASAAQNDQPVYFLNPFTNEWQELTALQLETVQPGVAYWIYSRSASDFSGSLNVELDNASLGLDYAEFLVEQVVRITNQGALATNVSVELFPSNEGDALPPLEYWQVDTSEDWDPEWTPLSSTVQKSLAEEETWYLRLAVNRRGLTSSASGILKISDDQGNLQWIPVRVDPADYRGLWVGSVAIDKISQPAHPSDPLLERPTASAAQFRIIVHVDEGNQARLLQQVTLMWEDGADANTPGRHVLVTDDALLPNYRGSTLRDGEEFGRRISSVAFAFETPQALSGVFGTALNTTLLTDYQDPLNPFVHTYHPDHDNLDRRYENILPEGTESFTISRSVNLDFTADDPEGFVLAGWNGGSQLGGAYSETLSGVHKNDIRIEGTFRLHKVSPVATLNE